MITWYLINVFYYYANFRNLFKADLIVFVQDGSSTHVDLDNSTQV